MNIHLSKIAAKNLGPIKKLNCELGQFNLFYARNEQGKTYLVEFLIRSLFKNQSRWKNTLRATNGGGKVSLRGLSSEIVEFDSTSSAKLEDYLLEKQPGLPPDIGRILVVKGAETGIARQGGISKAIIKQLLSSKEILDIVDSDKNISKTLKETVIEDKSISGSNRGEIKEKNTIFENLRRLNEIIKNLEEVYSGGERQVLESRKKELEAERAELLKAKRNKAYELDKEISKLNKQQAGISEDDISEVKSLMTSFNTENGNYDELKKDLEKAEKNSENYRWLEKTSERYESYLKEIKVSPDKKWLIGISLLAVITVILILIEQSIGAIIAFLAFLALGAFHLYNHLKAISKKPLNDEVAKVENEFKNRTGEELTSQARLNIALEDEKKDFQTAENLKKQVEEKEGKVEKLKSDIIEGLKKITGSEEILQNDWEKKIQSLQSEVRVLREKMNRKKEKLAGLNVDESDYYEFETEQEYSKIALEEIEKKIEAIKKKIDEEENKLQTLKRRICDIIDEDINEDWDELITKIYDKHEKEVEEYKDLIAEIAGKIAVHQIVEKLRKKEDEKISGALASDSVQNPIYQLTNRYNKISMQNNEFIISDDFSNFKIDNLSTGAQEQIFLALRLGFTSHLLKRNKLFLILDDALQHCDWPKREVIVKQLANLAQENWQIIYLTMDDHIRDLFRKVGKQFGNNFKEVILSTK